MAYSYSCLVPLQVLLSPMDHIAALAIMQQQRYSQVSAPQQLHYTQPLIPNAFEIMGCNHTTG